MENRKIVKSGNTSYILALPIEWIRKNNLDRGKLVQVSENGQGDLLISAEKRKEMPKQDIVTIKIDNKDDQMINLEFLTAYIRDASLIIFEGKQIIPKTSRILENVRFFIGLDVIEQSTSNIVVKNFFSLDKETSPYLLAKKMDITIRASFELLQVFFRKEFAKEDFFELQKLNEQNERLFTLIWKSTLKLFEYPQLMKTIQTTHLQILKERMFVQSLKNISLALLFLGRNLLFLDYNKQEVKNFQKVFLKTYSNYQDIINAINNKSYEQIRLFLKEYPSFSEETDKFLKTLDDPLMVQAASSFPIIYRSLQEMAYEALT